MKDAAYGLVEVLGSSNAILWVDKMVKTSDVYFKTWNTKCGGHATVFMSGDVAAVTAAVQRVSEAPLCDVIASAVISNPSGETVRLVEESAVRNGFAPKVKEEKVEKKAKAEENVNTEEKAEK